MKTVENQTHYLCERFMVKFCPLLRLKHNEQSVSREILTSCSCLTLQIIHDAFNQPVVVIAEKCRKV